MPTVRLLDCAIALTSSATASSSASAAVTRLTSPHSSAVGASMGCPVSSISSARLRPIARDSGTIGVEQNRPILTPGVAKRGPPAGAGATPAGANELAAAGGRRTVHLGDHRLGQPVDALHQFRADVEQPLVE